MQTCPICGSRWDSDDPFCPSCSGRSEEREGAPDTDEPAENGERNEVERSSGPERDGGPGRESGPGRDSNGPGYGAAASNGGDDPHESGVHAVAKRKSVPPPKPEARSNTGASADEEGASDAAYGSAVLALSDSEEEVELPDDVADEAADRPPGDSSSDPSGKESASATNGAAGSRASTGLEPEASPRERGRDSQPPKKAAGDETPRRPPVLASEALRKEVAPQEPGRVTIRVLLLVLGLVGSVSSLLLMRFTGFGVPLAGAFIGLTLLGVPPIPYAARAVAAVTISACSLGVVTWMNLAHSGSSPVIAETIGLTILAAALFFRAWHRGSTLARFLVLLGLLVSASWLGTSGALSNMTTLDPMWQSWLPIVLRAPLALLMMLSLLAFMDERSTGGCGIWATGVVLWEGIDNGVQLLVRFWPPALATPDWSLLGGGEAVPLIAGPLLSTLVAFGTAQLLAVTATAEEPSAEKGDDEE